MRVVSAETRRHPERMTTPWFPITVLAVLMAASSTGVASSASDSACDPNPRATSTADPERDKHHGTSGTDPDSMGSSTRKMPSDAKQGQGGTQEKLPETAPVRH